MKQKMLSIKSIQLRIMKKKHKGAAQLVAALLAMVALIAVLFFTVYTVQDLDRIQVVDQIARKAVLKLETRGKLSSEEINKIKEELKGKPLEATFEGSDGVYAQYKDASGNWVNIPAEGVPYGTEIGIYIQCEVNTTKISDNFSLFSNQTMKKESKHTIKRMKTSISKAPTKN